MSHELYGGDQTAIEKIAPFREKGCKDTVVEAQCLLQNIRGISCTSNRLRETCRSCDQINSTDAETSIFLNEFYSSKMAFAT